MDANFVLDSLLILILLLFIPIGLWRGGVKEALVAGSILLGAAGANAWATSWGDDLARWFDRDPDLTRFLVAMTSLTLSTLLLGYGAGFAFGDEPSVHGRLAGAVFAAINATLLVAYSLLFVERFLLDSPGDSALDDGVVANVLLRHFGWILLAIGVATLATVVIGAMLRRQVDPADLVLSEPAPGPLRPVRTPRVADAGKFEPEPPLIRVVDPEPEPIPAGRIDARDRSLWPTAHPVEESEHDQIPTTAAPPRLTGDDWGHRVDSIDRGRSIRPATAPASSGPSGRVTNLWEARGWSPARANPAIDPSPSDAVPADRCLTCGSPLSPSERYCPECGAGR